MEQPGRGSEKGGVWEASGLAHHQSANEGEGTIGQHGLAGPGYRATGHGEEDVRSRFQLPRGSGCGGVCEQQAVGSSHQ